MTCSFKGCNKNTFVKHTPHGELCNGHYKQHRKGKALTELRSYKPRVLAADHGTCPVTNCDRPSWHKQGLCQSHQRQKWQEKNYTEVRNYSFQESLVCEMAGCNGPAKSRGYCSTHYRSDWGVCEYPGCARKMYNKHSGYCASHYVQFRRITRINPSLSHKEILSKLIPIRCKTQKSGTKIKENKNG